MLATLLAPLQSIQEMATDDRFNDMVKFFFIAVVLVVPICLIVWRRAAKKHAREAAERNPQPSPEELTPPDPHDLKVVVANIDAASRSLAAGESAKVAVPRDLTLDGSPAAEAIIDALIGDVITRNRVSATWSAVADGRTVTLTK